MKDVRVYAGLQNSLELKGNYIQAQVPADYIATEGSGEKYFLYRIITWDHLGIHVGCVANRLIAAQPTLLKGALKMCVDVNECVCVCLYTV